MAGTKPRSSLPASAISTPLPRRIAARSLPGSPADSQSSLHHHKTSDELAIQEAAMLIGSLQAESLEDEGLSQRERRHLKLNALRNESTEEREEEAGDGGIGNEGGADAEESNTLLEGVSEEIPCEEDSVLAENEGDNGDSSSSQDDDGSTSSKSESDSSETEEESDDQEDEDEQLQKLLEKAKLSAMARSSAAKLAISEAEKEKEGELRFDGTEGILQDKRKEAPIPDIAIPSLPTPHLSFNNDGTAKAAVHLLPTSQAGPSKLRAHVVGGTPGKEAPELDRGTYEKALSKREKAAQPKKATPSELWSTIPAPRTDMLPQMKRDYQALALANSLDPKRFMKGGNKAGKIPERFAIGTLVEPPRHLQDTTLTSARKYRPGQVVDGLVKNDDIGGYAKRKYGELQGGRMDNGRGKGWKKKSKW
ncbi:hypothetical protein P7C73_g6488, partial [Tremellales sp. Uapishka_1]